MFSRTVTMMTAILAASSVYAHPIRDTGSVMDTEQNSGLLPRDPRLIPDTTHYVAEVLNELGVAPPPSSETSSHFPTPTTTSEAGQPENYEHKATSTPVPVSTSRPSPNWSSSSSSSSSSATPTTTGDTLTFTTTIKNGNNKPFENIQIGTGWDGKKRIEASDVPVILAAVETELAHRFNDMVDSQDEMLLWRH